ncbi:MAG: hypothetical protein ACMUIE_00145 [Thermoplasmatota archaeon]
MKIRKTEAMAGVLILCILPMMVSGAQPAGLTVKEGEPLHLYIRRSPVQDDTYLYFHPPEGKYYNDSFDDLGYRKTLFQKGSGNDTVMLFYPQDPNSNFLQFEPNSTLQLRYNFTISAIAPDLQPDLNYRLGVRIELDYQHDGDYDQELYFEIGGLADSEPRVKEGTIQVDISELEKFDGKEGGRIRITLSREDELDSTLTIYCGNKGFHSWLQLPFSKYKYEGDNGENGNGNTAILVILLASGAAVVLVAAIMIRRSGKKKEEPVQEPVSRSARRRKR